MERTGAAAYHVMWSEEAIRKLMCSQKLRDVRPPTILTNPSFISTI